MYRKMGIFDCIAASPSHYVDIAVRIGTDCSHAEELRRRISASQHLLFEDARVVREFERFFVAAVADAQ
jgi:predicted O-linked N-acetylglucosamine transferase (SPINDLY family)